MPPTGACVRSHLRRTAIGLLVVSVVAVSETARVPSWADASPGRSPAQAPCPVTKPGPSSGGFNYGHARLRVNLWPRGVLPAGPLPGGGSYATIQADGSIRAKLGWWRGVEGRLRISGARLDQPALPLSASVPGGYLPTGFQPSGLIFPTEGCWRVVGQVGRARLAFVVRVLKLRA